MVAGLGGSRPLFFQNYDDMMTGCVTILRARMLRPRSRLEQRLVGYPYRVTTEGAHLRSL